MANIVPTRPSELVDPKDSPALIRLFSETLKLAETAVAGKSRASMPPPGPFWLLANRNPSLADLAKFWRGEMPPGWPPWFERTSLIVYDGALRDAFLHCLDAAPIAG